MIKRYANWHLVRDKMSGKLTIFRTASEAGRIAVATGQTNSYDYISSHVSKREAEAERRKIGFVPVSYIPTNESKGV